MSNVDMNNVERYIIILLLKYEINYRYLRWIIQPDRAELIVFLRNGEQLKIWIRPKEDPDIVMQRLQALCNTYKVNIAP